MKLFVACMLMLTALVGCTPAFANSVQICSPSPITATPSQVGGSYQETLTSAGLITGGACVAPTPGPSIGACVEGAPSDIPGLTAVCAGPITQHKGGTNIPLPYGAYTFERTFGSTWPGNYFGYAEIIQVQSGRYLSIPFKPSPGHTVTFSFNDTFSPNSQNVFSISTAEGLFNNGVANGTTVLCAAGTYPSLTVSSNGSAGNCPKLDPNKTYWLNMVPGVAFNGTFVACSKSPCVVSVQESSVN